MILLFIIFISFVRLLLYYFIEKYSLKFPKPILLVLVLIGYYFVFPQYFMPEPKGDGINCGMPAMGILLGFWVFGTIAGIATHIIWIIKSQKKKHF